MSIINNTSIGVGTTTPSYHLDVSGNSHVTGNSYTLGSLGVGTSTPSYTLDISGNARFNGSIYSSGIPTMLKQISNKVSYTPTSPTIGVGFQNPYSTPMFILCTIVTGGTDVLYNLYSDANPTPTTFLGNGVIHSGNTLITFIVLPYYYWMINGTNLSLGYVTYFY